MVLFVEKRIKCLSFIIEGGKGDIIPKSQIIE